uniref:Vef-2 n=1 Tax=Lymantria dispar multicapsid nuclear polyhedrosis virus TaxID=10449 RepID=A0A0D3QVV0_NPVLD|nr:vef-2 [Lymantria dispar multiple nucleopolyhedrovirus]
MEFALSIEPTRVPQWLAPDTNQLGLHHGRVHLNYVCDASSGVRIRMRNAARVPRLTLRFLNADSREERTVVVDASNDDTFWSHDRLAVPFVDRPVGDEPADVSVTITSPAYALPLYEHGGNVAPADFKQSWRNSVSPYALVDIGNTAFLVPPADRELVTADAFDLIRLRDHYESIYRHYENAILVSDSPTAPAADRVYARQFFCKADAGSGAGIAFYGQHWIGASANTLLRYLNVDADPWLILHEIGHGHEFAFVGTAPPLIEVWTNILPNLFQFDTMTSAERQTAAWIYDHGRREAVERGLGALIDQRVDYDKFSFRERLFAYAPLTQTSAGRRAFQRMHIQLRRFNMRGDGPTEYLIADWWSNAAETDCLPLFMLMQQKVVSCCRYGRDVRPVYTFERALGAFKRIPYPACRLLSDFDTRSNNYGMPGLETTFAPVYPAQSNASVAELTIVMHIDEPAQIAGGAVRRLALGVRGGRRRDSRAVRLARARRRVRPARAARSRPALRHHHTREPLQRQGQRMHQSVRDSDQHHRARGRAVRAEARAVGHRAPRRLPHGLQRQVGGGLRRRRGQAPRGADRVQTATPLVLRAILHHRRAQKRRAGGRVGGARQPRRRGLPPERRVPAERRHDAHAVRQRDARPFDLHGRRLAAVANAVPARGERRAGFERSARAGERGAADSHQTVRGHRLLGLGALAVAHRKLAQRRRSVDDTGAARQPSANAHPLPLLTEAL